MRTRKLETTDDYIRNFQRAKNPCAVCGRNVKRPAGWVYLVNGGCEILHPDDEESYEEDDTGDLGCYP